MRRPLASLAVAAACGHPAAPRPTGCPETATLASPADVAALAGCTRLGALAIRTAGALDVGSLALEEITGDVVVGPSFGLAELRLGVRAIGGDLRVVSNGDLRGLYLPRLERVGRVTIEADVALATIAMPRLGEAKALSFAELPELELIELSGLRTAGELAIDNAPELAVVEVATPTLGTVRVARVPKLSADSLTALGASRTEETAPDPGTR